MEILTQERIDQFLHLLRQNGIETHAITIYQQDKCLLNRAFFPYEVTALHPLYSVSKSFLSAAVGYLVVLTLIHRGLPIARNTPTRSLTLASKMSQFDIS